MVDNNNNNDAQNQTNDLLKQLIEEQKKSNKPEPPPPAPPEPEQEDPRYDGVLSSLLATFQDNFDFVRSSNAEEVLERRKNRAEKRREAASKAGPKGPSIREKMGETLGDAKEKISKKGLKGIAKFITKGLGIAIITPIIADFVGGLIDGVITEAFGEEAAEKYGGMIKIGGILAVVGGLLFGPMAILPLFFAGIMGALGKKLVDGISDETLEKFGIDKGTLGGVVAAVGAALGLFVPMLLKKAITGTAKLALKMVTGGAALAGNLVKSVVKGPKPTTKPGSGGSGGRPPPVKPGGVPSGMRVNKAGRMIHANTGRFASADDIAKAMKLEGRASQVAKYMKFFKFAGPAMAIVPALIDPLLAIYNDAGPDEIKKQLAGALGTVGGVALGGLAGTALGTGIFPGVGSAIGGFLGMGLGAYLGEDLAEKIADAVLSGDDIDPSIVSKQQQRRQNRSKSNASGATPSSIKVAGTNANISLPSSSNVKIAPTGGETASAKVATLEGGTQIVLAGGGGGGNMTNVAKGGDTVNSTNVGGSNTTFNIVNNGNRSLSNSGHLPVGQAV
ncbi:hypothetical protein N9M52_00230 [bacterium]|nr:hypothetical protein [bacterium]